MTFRQKVLKLFYPLLMVFARYTKNGKIVVNKDNATPKNSFYNLNAIANNGEQINFSSFKGKKVLIVNTASDCGYTAQYEELEKLFEQEKGDLIILAFPANDFNNQEKESDETIMQFCMINFGVSFPVMKKTVVVKKINQHKVFEWLTNKTKNGWNDKAPVWNFCKYFVDENGVLTHFFGTAISPTGKEICKAINTL